MKQSMSHIELLGSKLYYSVHGDGIPVLNIHGWGVDHRLMKGCLEPVFETSGHQLMRIYFDLPGMGQSIASDAIKNADDMLDVIMAFIDAIIPEKPFILTGESFGGYLSRGLVQKRREQILGLLLICPLVIPGYRKGDLPAFRVMEKDSLLLDQLSDFERSCFESITVVQSRKVWERFKEDILDAINPSNDFLNHVLDGSFSYDVDALDKPYDKPSLILTGRQDAEVGYKDQFKLLEMYVGASYAVLDKAGHNLQIEQDVVFNSLVGEWISRVMAAV